MATEKQIAANRANAKRSTGPKTAAGKLKSSGNAYRHGLSGPVRPTPETLTMVHSITRELTGEQATQDRRKLVADFALAHLELLRINAIRTEQFAKVDPNGSSDPDKQELNRLAALDRYERYALTKRRRASRALQSEG
jgi:nitrate reductase beta subunit